MFGKVSVKTITSDNSKSRFVLFFLKLQLTIIQIGQSVTVS